MYETEQIQSSSSTYVNIAQKSQLPEASTTVASRIGVCLEAGGNGEGRGWRRRRLGLIS